jgi:hypothetical protein
MTSNDTTGRRNDTRGTVFVPRVDANPEAARYETMTPARAVDRIAEVGFSRSDAQQMVAGYLTEQTARHGEPAGGWEVDPYDLAEIASAYEWVDHYRGETLAQARDRAAEYTGDYQRRASTVDRDQEPGYAARLDREAVEWAARARVDDNPSPASGSGSGVAKETFGDLIDAADDVPPTAEQAARSAMVTSASWAIAARDTAIEMGATEHAAWFAREAREALAVVDAAGITREQLAYELDYPGGAAELDGEHIDVGIGVGIGGGEPWGNGDVEEDRRQQLNLWHHDQLDETGQADDIDHADGVDQNGPQR